MCIQTCLPRLSAAGLEAAMADLFLSLRDSALWAPRGRPPGTGGTSGGPRDLKIAPVQSRTGLTRARTTMFYRCILGLRGISLIGRLTRRVHRRILLSQTALFVAYRRQLTLSSAPHLVHECLGSG